MKRRAIFSLLVGTVALAACDMDLTVPNYNAPSIDDLQANPSNSGVMAAATGVVIGTRQGVSDYVRLGAIPGREGYFLDPNEGRYVRQLAAGTPDASDFTGGSYWGAPYNVIRTANIILSVIDDPRITLSPAERSGIEGFTKTMIALNFLQISNWRDQIPVDVNVSPEAPPAPLVSRTAALQHIASLLDEAYADLNAAGTGNFVFPTGAGIAQFGFNSVPNFAQYNRALKARVEVYRATLTAAPVQANYTAALAALNQSFISVADPSRTGLNRGLYHSYSPTSGDLANALRDNSGKLVADSRLRTQAELQPSGLRDARFLLKVDSGTTNQVSIGLTSDLRFAMYDTRPFFGSGGQSSPIPSVRNEELILLRAEARWFTGDRPGAMADLNFVRQNSGGLAALAQPADDAGFITALLAERRYSLLFEGSHRWIDYRRFGRLAQIASTPSNDPARANDHSFPFFPLPVAEQLARG